MNLYAPDIKKLMIFIANNILQKSCLLRELCPDTKVRYFYVAPLFLKKNLLRLRQYLAPDSQI